MDLLQLIIAVTTKWIPLLLAIKSLDQSIDSKPLSIQSFRIIINYLISLVIIDNIKSIVDNQNIGYLLEILRFSIFFSNINNTKYLLVLINRLPYQFQIPLQDFDDYLTSIFHPNSEVSLFHHWLIRLQDLSTASNSNYISWHRYWNNSPKVPPKYNVLPPAPQTNQLRRVSPKTSTPNRSRSSSLRSNFLTPSIRSTSRRTSNELPKPAFVQPDYPTSEYVIDSPGSLSPQNSNYYPNTTVPDNEIPPITSILKQRSVSPPQSIYQLYFSENDRDNVTAVNTLANREGYTNGTISHQLSATPSRRLSISERPLPPIAKVNRIVSNGTTKTYNAQEAKEIVDGVFTNKKKNSILKDIFSH